MVVNEALVKKLGLRSPEEIIGKNIAYVGWNRKVPVVGVFKDYNNKSLREAIMPVAITTEYNTYEWIAVRMDRKSMAGTMENVHKLFSSIYPTYMFDPVFFDERIERFYEMKRSPRNCSGYLPSWLFLFPVLVYTALYPLWQYKRQRKSVSAKCWVLLFRASFIFFQKSLPY